MQDSDRVLSQLYGHVAWEGGNEGFK
uniref:Uncharacterized protein n=1 Tax=Anguilla anguilla TaxID=7936 RepID=A0A0E9Q0T4_ANGAN